MSSPAVRTVLPLALITCSGMLAMDLYLPAVPNLQHALGLTVPQGQATIAVFLAGLAASQLIWGEALHRFGPQWCARVGLALLALASFGCALVADYGLLLALRVLQGIGAGASTVISPSVIKSTLGERDAHRGIAAVAMIEAIVPAAGPVLGTLLLLAVDWPWTFAAIGVLTLLSAPLALRVIPHASPAGDDAGSGYAALLRDRRFLRLASAHALSFAALFVFVGSGPQVLNPAWGLHAFALAQVVGVACFIAAASQSGKLGERLGTGRVVKAGAWLHLALCLLFLGCIALGIAPFGAVLVFWGLFCAVLGVRGPAAFTDALRVPMNQIGRASGLFVLLILVACGVVTQLTAFFLDAHGLAAVLCAMVLACAASLALVTR